MHRRAQHELWIWEAIEYLTDQAETEAAERRSLIQEDDTDPMSARSSPSPSPAGGRRRSKAMAERSKDEEQLVKGSDLVMKYVGSELEWEMTARQERYRQAET